MASNNLPSEPADEVTKELVVKLRARPKDAATMLEVRNHFLSQRRFASLIKLLSWWAQQVDSAALIAQVYYESGLAVERWGGSLREILSLYSEAVKRQPTHMQALSRIAYHDPERAIERLEKVLDRDPANVDVLRLLEKTAPETLRNTILVPRWQAFIQGAPHTDKAAECRLSLARAYRQQGRVADALQVIEPLASTGHKEAVSLRDTLEGNVTRGESRFSIPGPKVTDASIMAVLDELEGEVGGTVDAASTLDPGGPFASGSPFARNGEFDEEIATVVTQRRPRASTPVSASSSSPSHPSPNHPSPSRPKSSPPPLKSSRLKSTRPSASSMSLTGSGASEPAPSIQSAPPMPSVPSIEVGSIATDTSASQKHESAPLVPSRFEMSATARLRTGHLSGQDPSAVPEGALRVDAGGDEDEDDLLFEGPGASSVLADASFARSRARRGPVVMEVVRLRDGITIGRESVRGPAFRARLSNGLITASLGLRGGRIKLRRPAEGIIKRSGSYAVEEQLRSGKKAKVKAGDTARIAQDGVEHVLRVYRAPALPPVPKESLPWRSYAGAAGLGLVLHGIGFALVAALGSLGVSLRVEDRPQEEIFAEARMEPVKTEPKEQPKKQVIRRAPKKPTPPAETRTRLPKVLRQRLRRAARSKPGANASERLVQALTQDQQGDTSLADVVTNVDAVRGDASSAAVRVSGLLGQLEGEGVNIADRSASAIKTVGGRKATAGLSRLAARKGGPVRGKVRAINALTKVQGSLSRGEVSAAINKKIGRIQRCYERGLTQTPNLAGRLTYSWTIRPNGRVSGVRQSSGSLGNAKVASCISGIIRGIRFPKPRGGPVSVTYPFVFQRAP